MLSRLVPGYSCQLLTTNMTLCILDTESLDSTRTQLHKMIESLGENLGKENEIGFIVNGDVVISCTMIMTFDQLHCFRLSNSPWISNAERTFYRLPFRARLSFAAGENGSKDDCHL